MVAMTAAAARTDRSASSGRVRAVAAIVAGVGFVLVVAANPRTRGVGLLVLVGLVLVVTIAGGSRLRAGPIAAVGAGLVALVSLWLVPQRDDTAAMLILAALYGVAIGVLARAQYTRAGADRRGGRIASVAVGVVVLVASGVHRLRRRGDTGRDLVRRRHRARTDERGHQVALTFDDGPNVGSTEKVHGHPRRATA